MIEPTTGYIITCDICGEELALYDGCTAVFDTESEASTNARECGWKETELGKWACMDCIEGLDSED